MTEYRIVGKVGPEELIVHTAWLDEDREIVDGLKMGLELNGWDIINVEERDG